MQKSDGDTHVVLSTIYRTTHDITIPQAYTPVCTGGRSVAPLASPCTPHTSLLTSGPVSLFFLALLSQIAENGKTVAVTARLYSDFASRPVSSFTLALLHSAENGENVAVMAHPNYDTPRTHVTITFPFRSRPSS